jgi:Luciferase
VSAKLPRRSTRFNRAVAGLSQYDRAMSRSAALVDEIANELATWPGVRIERRADGAALVRYGHSELGVLYPDRGVVELPVLEPEHDELIEHGDAEPAGVTSESSGVSHGVHGPADVTAVLELFDRRYRDVRGDEDPYSSTDPG